MQKNHLRLGTGIKRISPVPAKFIIDPRSCVYTCISKQKAIRLARRSAGTRNMGSRCREKRHFLHIQYARIKNSHGTPDYKIGAAIKVAVFKITSFSATPFYINSGSCITQKTTIFKSGMVGPDYYCRKNFMKR